MNIELTKEWIVALLSGEYPQGRQTLKNSHGEFCCLGVLCDLEVQKGNGSWGAPDNSYKGLTASLPHRLQQKVGIDEQFMSYLIALNDHRKKDFKEIARVIAIRAGLMDFYKENLE